MVAVAGRGTAENMVFVAVGTVVAVVVAAVAEEGIAVGVFAAWDIAEWYIVVGHIVAGCMLEIESIENMAAVGVAADSSDAVLNVQTDA